MTLLNDPTARARVLAHLSFLVTEAQWLEQQISMAMANNPTAQELDALTKADGYLGLVVKAATEAAMYVQRLEGK